MDVATRGVLRGVRGIDGPPIHDWMATDVGADRSAADAVRAGSGARLAPGENRPVDCPDGLSPGVALEPYRHEEHFSDTRRFLVRVPRGEGHFLEARARLRWCSETADGHCQCSGSDSERGTPRAWLYRRVYRLFPVAGDTVGFCPPDP